MFSAMIHGFILALGLILPLGVQNVFVFNQGALHAKFRRALPVVLTAAICDTLLVLAAVYGLSVLVFGNVWVKNGLLGAGILFLLYMGWVTWNSKPAQSEKVGSGQTAFTIKKQIGFAASVSLLNPHAIMDTVGVIGTSSLAYSGLEKLTFALACVGVSWLWFTGLALTGRIVGRMDKSGRFMLVLNKASALVMWGTAVYLGQGAIAYLLAAN